MLVDTEAKIIHLPLRDEGAPAHSW